MAKNLLWFKCDLNFDSRIQELTSEFGALGAYTYLVLLQLIYADEGYFLSLSEAQIDEVVHRTKAKVEDIKRIVDSCISKHLFDPAMYEKYHILTSHGIQYRFYDCAARRQDQVIKPEHLLLSENEVFRTKKEREEYSLSKEREKNNKDDMETERQKLCDETGISSEEYAELLKQCDGDVLELNNYLIKIFEWARKKNVTLSKSYVIIKNWITSDKESMHQKKEEKNNDASYDINAWQRFVENFEPNFGSTPTEPEPTSDRKEQP